ncbi:hypothetical protein GNZ11_09430 [Paraburkholderia xenovorans]|nr:hypothetical protein [Paraburkholderia xenovorans]
MDLILRAGKGHALARYALEGLPSKVVAETSASRINFSTVTRAYLSGSLRSAFRSVRRYRTTPRPSSRPVRANQP